MSLWGGGGGSPSTWSSAGCIIQTGQWMRASMAHSAWMGWCEKEQQCGQNASSNVQSEEWDGVLPTSCNYDWLCMGGVGWGSLWILVWVFFNQKKNVDFELRQCVDHWLLKRKMYIWINAVIWDHAFWRKLFYFELIQCLAFWETEKMDLNCGSVLLFASFGFIWLF